MASQTATFFALLRSSPPNLSTIRAILSAAPSLATTQDEVDGVSPLMVAASIGSVDLCTVLVTNGAPWNALDRKGECAGDYAVAAGHQDVVDYLVDVGTKCEMILGAAMNGSKEAPAASNEKEESR